MNIKINVNGACAQAVADGVITAGMVGATYDVSYSPEWDGLTKVVVFSGSGEVRTAIDGIVPHLVLKTANTILRAGVEGRNNDGTLVIPTVWASVDYIRPAADASADPDTDPSNPVWAQITAAIGDPKSLHTDCKENLVCAINELHDGAPTAPDGGFLADFLYTESSPEATEKTVVLPGNAAPKTPDDKSVLLIRFAKGSTADKVTLKIGTGSWEMARNPWRYSDLAADCPVGEIPAGHTIMVRLGGQYALWQDCGFRPLVSLAEEQFGWDMMKLIQGEKQETKLTEKQTELAKEIENKISQAGGTYVYFTTYDALVKLSNFNSQKNYFRFNAIDLGREFIFNYDKTTVTVSAYMVGYATKKDLQLVEENKADRSIYLLNDSVVTQDDARDILAYADQYTGIIEFISTSESKVSAIGYIISNSDGTCLVTITNDGTSTQWSKDGFSKYNIEARNLINEPVIDTDNLTVDVVGNPPVLYMLRNARNKPEGSGADGSMMVIPHSISKQIFIYTDMDTAKMWTKVVTGTDGRHQFGVWAPLGSGGASNASELNATVPEGLPPETEKNTQAVLNALSAEKFDKADVASLFDLQGGGQDKTISQRFFTDMVYPVHQRFRDEAGLNYIFSAADSLEKKTFIRNTNKQQNDAQILTVQFVNGNTVTDGCTLTVDKYTWDGASLTVPLDFAGTGKMIALPEKFYAQIYVTNQGAHLLNKPEKEEGQFELINEVTIKGDMPIYFDKDQKGNPLRLKRAFLTIWDTSKKTITEINFEGLQQGDHSTIAWAIYLDTSQGEYNEVDAVVSGGLVDGVYRQSTDKWNYYSVKSFNGYARHIPNGFSCISLVESTKNIKDGSIIKLYGVRI